MVGKGCGGGVVVELGVDGSNHGGDDLDAEGAEFEAEGLRGTSQRCFRGAIDSCVLVQRDGISYLTRQTIVMPAQMIDACGLRVEVALGRRTYQ